MSTLYWLRIARKAKLYKQPEYPNIEALLESEADQPSDDYRLMAKIIPASIIGFGVVIAIGSTFLTHNLWCLLSTVLAGAAATAVYFILDSFDKKIPRSRAHVRKQAKAMLERICGLSNIVGVEPAMSPSVGPILDEAARIYMKHRSDPPVAERQDSRSRGETALEEAMARMMDLGAQPNARAQDMELEKGWALKLLQEMREMDQVLNRLPPSGPASSLSMADPVASLRDIRLELLGTEAAMSELKQDLNQQQ